MAQPRAATCSSCGIAIDKYLARLQTPTVVNSASKGSVHSSIPYHLITRLLQLLLLLSIGIAVWSYLKKDVIPEPGFYGQQMLAEPTQTATDRQPFDVEASGITYRINPLFDYRLEGVVVSFHNSDSWWDIYHQKSWKDFINVKDLCVIWGGNISTGVYQDLEFKNSTWTCWVYWPDQETGRRFQMQQLSNNHLLVHNPEFSEALRDVQIGDQITLSGVLASYSHSNKQFQRGSSTTRTDTGNGACETIYLDHFSIVREANSGWRRLYAVAKGIIVLCLLSLILLVFISPARRIA